MMEHNNRLQGAGPEPSEDQIAALLRQMRFRPGPRLQQQIDGMPWRQAGAGATRRLRLSLSSTLVALALLLGAALALPSVRAIAAEWLYFTHTESDTLNRSITFVTPPPAVTGDRAVETVEAQAGFDVLEPAYLATGWKLERASYNSETKKVTLSYQSTGDTDETSWVSVHQRRSTSDSEPITVGAGAHIEAVEVNGWPGEYKRGIWISEVKMPTPAPGTCEEDCVHEPPTPAPGETRSVELQWNPDFPQHEVLWRNGDMMYQVSASGSQFTKEEVLAIAESLR